MLFTRDLEHERRIWVDRGTDCRLDNFEVCAVCDAVLKAQETEDSAWRELDDLCLECRTDFQAHALAVDLFGLPRPFNGDIQGRYITNAEAAEAAPPGFPASLAYFLPERDDL